MRQATTTWIVVAHRGGARLVDEHEDKLRIFETLDNPGGRTRESQPGGDSVPPPPDSHGHRAPPARESAREHAATTFASQLAEMLRKHRNANSYSELVLIAAPRFLGSLRRALDPSTAAMVRGTLDKDYGSLDDHELLRRLTQL